MIPEQIVAALIADGEWPERNARAFVRANFKCEYCGFEFLSSIEAYKAIEIEHIDPSLPGDAREHLDNIAMACRHCNTHLKNDWNPTNKTHAGARREDLIAAVKVYCEELRKKRTARLQHVRRLVGYVDSDAEQVHPADPLQRAVDGRR
jgi:hypothetical protein